ncbi:MAG: T9SS type A sorting domain-containing protein [Candidatus Kapabacteria bacterium]|nr:T9SS type A sorting domain-containing protein [Candidatus Kapabacteria bacterium]
MQPDSRQQTADSRQQTVTHQFIVDSNTMNVQYPIQGINAMSLMKKCFSSSKHCVFIFLFILSNLLFFQPSQAQLSNPYDVYTCDDDEGCPWINDSTEFVSPGPDPSCMYTVYYKYRNCNGYLELQPTAVRHPGTTACQGAIQFYGDTLVIQRIEQLLKTAELDLVSKFFDDFYNPLPIGEQVKYKVTLDTFIVGTMVSCDTSNCDMEYFRSLADSFHVTIDCFNPNLTCSEVRYDTTYIPLRGDSTYKIGFYRPACRGICISYGRIDSLNPINSVYGKWYNCGTGCCEIISELSYYDYDDYPDNIIPKYPYYFYDGNYVRTSYTRGVADTCQTLTPSTSCPTMSFNTNVIRFKNCRNYCVDSSVGNGYGVYGPDHYDPYGISSNDNSRFGVVNLNEMPFISDKIIKEIPNDIILELTNNDIVVNTTEDVLSVKVVSLTGEVLLNTNTIQGKTFQIISLQSFQNGLYLLVFETKNGTTTKPLIIAK